MASKLPAALYVFDATCLIEFERTHALAFLSDLGTRVCIPSRVAREVNKPNTPLERWLQKNPGVVKRFVPGSQEEEIYYRLTIDSGSRLGDGEAAAIAMALNRSGLLVTDDRAASEVAQALGVACITTRALRSAPLV